MNKEELIVKFINNLGDLDIDPWNRMNVTKCNKHSAARFLRRCDWKLFESEKLYRKMIEWRKINKINKIKENEPFGQNNSTVLPFVYNYNFMDKWDIPVEIVNVEKLDLEKLDRDDVVEELVIKEEYFFDTYNNINKYGIIIIYDFNKFIINKFTLLKFIPTLKFISEYIDNYYPGRARKVYFINVSPIICMGYNFIKVFMPQDTRDMTRVYDCNQVENFITDIIKYVQDLEGFKKFFLE